MSQDKGHFRSKSKSFHTSRKLSHYQKKVTDRQHLEAAYRNQVGDSDRSEVPPVQQQTTTQVQGQQPSFVYVPEDQSTYNTTFDLNEFASQNVPFDLDQVNTGNQDSGYDDGSSLAIGRQELFFPPNLYGQGGYGTSTDIHGDGGLEIRGPPDSTSLSSAPSSTFTMQQQPSQAPESRISPHASPSPLPPPVRDRFELERTLTTPTSPRSPMSPASSARSSPRPPRTPPAVQRSPYTPSPGKNITTNSSPNTTCRSPAVTYEPYVPPMVRSVPLDTSPNKTPVVTATYNPSRGKNISFSDNPSVHDSESGSDVEEEYEAAEQISQIRVREIFDETVPLNKCKTIEELRAFIENHKEGKSCEKDLFTVNESRIRLLSLIGKYVDTKNKNTLFENGFSALYQSEVVDLRKTWERFRHSESVLVSSRVNFPRSIRWLLVHLIICYSRCVNRPNDVIPTTMVNRVKAMKDDTPKSILDVICSLNTMVSKTSRKRVACDDTEESDYNDPSSPAQKTKRRPNNYQEGDEADSDVSSVVSTASRSWRSPKRAPTLTSAKRILNFSQPENETTAATPTCFNGIVYKKTNQSIKRQYTVCKTVPNVHLCKATKEVVLHVIKPNVHMVTFSEIMELLVSVTTTNLFDTPILNLAELCMRLSEIKERQEEVAFTVSTSMLSLVLTKASVTFDAVMAWCRIYCTTLNQVLCRASENIGQCDGNALRSNLKSEYENIIANVNEKMADHMREYSGVFNDLAMISDWCVYTLFGVSVAETGDAVDTSVLVKNILMCWMKLEKLPLQLHKEEFRTLDKVLWCIPLAHLTRLGGFGEPVEKVKELTTCSLDEYLDV